jgi:glycosyltransferase involved in cell wall biosynthesis
MRVAVVVPRYGPDVVGGAETLARGFAEEAARRGWTIEVWTTCARSHYTWKNAHPEGVEESRGVLVRRFPVALQDHPRHATLALQLASQGHLPVDDQYAWLESGAHSAPLYQHMAQHAAEFDVVVALPYAMPLVHYAAWTAPERVVVWPCLHDEPYAYMEPARLLLESVWGAMFLSPEERELAIRRLGTHLRNEAVLGGGVAVAPREVAPPQLQESPSDLLYVGRLEEGKGLPLLYEYVQRYADEGGNVRLVILGQGPLEPTHHPAFEHRGFVSEEEKSLAYASTLALCQPSVNESFSLTIMESWLAARPVLVHGDCAVTRGHVQRSKGGLWFRTYEEFVGAIEWLQANPALAARMGENGRQYVSDNYTWEAIVSRFERLIQLWGGGSG